MQLDESGLPDWISGAMQYAWAIVSFVGPDYRATTLYDFWPVTLVGRWHVAFTNPDGYGPAWVQSVYRHDVSGTTFELKPPVRVSPGRTVVFDLQSLAGNLAGADWPYVPPGFTVDYLPERDISLALVGGRWQVVQP